MTIVGEAVAPIIMGYCGYYGEYGDCLSHTAGMLWGDWNICVIETPRSSLDKRRIFRKMPRSCHVTMSAILKMVRMRR